MVTLCVVVIVQQLFTGHQYRALAIGVAMSGDSVGTLVSGPLTQALIDQYGWRGCMLIMTGLLMNMTLLATSFHHGVTHKQATISHKETLGTEEAMAQEAKPTVVALLLQSITQRMWDFSIFKNVTFSIYLVCCLISSFGLFPFYTHLTSRAVHYGMGRQMAASLSSVTGAHSLVGRLLVGLVASRKCAGLGVLTALTVLTAGALTIAYAMATTFPIFCLFCVIIGLLNGKQFL